jgi:hypothetical protein
MTSVTVRGDQMAEEMGGICIRHRYLTDSAAASSPAIVWIVEADLPQVKRFARLAPQVLDVINPAYPGDVERFTPQYAAFENLILTTYSSRHYLRRKDEAFRTWVIPHHHCNQSGWRLPESRLARPAVVGYVGQPEHLHDREAIQAHVEDLGLRFRMFDTTELHGYEEIDVGVAWTRRDEQRDLTRSNVKLSNFAAHGIPCVVCDYESYRDVNRTIGDVGLIAGTLQGFLDQIESLARDETLRRELAGRVPTAQAEYSRSAIARHYWRMINEL